MTPPRHPSKSGSPGLIIKMDSRFRENDRRETENDGRETEMTEGEWK